MKPPSSCPNVMGKKNTVERCSPGCVRDQRETQAHSGAGRPLGGGGESLIAGHRREHFFHGDTLLPVLRKMRSATIVRVAHTSSMVRTGAVSISSSVGFSLRLSDGDAG